MNQPVGSKMRLANTTGGRAHPPVVSVITQEHGRGHQQEEGRRGVLILMSYSINSARRAALWMLLALVTTLAAQAQRPADDFLLASGKAGPLELGMSVDEVYKIVGKDMTRLRGVLPVGHQRARPAIPHSEGSRRRFDPRGVEAAVHGGQRLGRGWTGGDRQRAGSDVRAGRRIRCRARQDCMGLPAAGEGAAEEVSGPKVTPTKRRRILAGAAQDFERR